MDHSTLRALARKAARLKRAASSLGVAALLAGPALAQDSSVAVENALKVVGSDGRTQTVEIDSDAHAHLAAGPSELKMTSVPLAGDRMEDFVLERFEVFAPNAELVAFDGKTTTPITPPDVVYYRGHGVNDPSESVFLSVDRSYEGQVHMMAMHPKRGTSILSPEKDAYGRTVHKLAPASGEGLENFACHAESLTVNREAMDKFAEPDSPVDAKLAGTVGAEILVDVTNHLYTSKFGSNQNTAIAYVGNVFAASSAIFQRDLNVVLIVKQATVWTSPDPFDAGSSDAQLANYVAWNKANRANVARDTAHLLAGRVSYGGIAYIGGLCMTNYGYGVSNIYGTYSLPTSAYTWDVNVVAHEVGHNFNSPHTHCYSPPIDCCYTGECSCGTKSAEAGTIMSYCHLTNNTGTVGMFFHQRCKDTMRAYADGRACLTAASSSGGGGTGPQVKAYGQTGMQIGNGDWTPSDGEASRFGPVRVGADQPKVQWFSIWNSGSAPLQLTGNQPVTITGTNPYDFWVSQQAPAVIQPNSGAWFAVAFRPTALGNRSAMIYIPTNDPANTLFSFWVDGHGVTTAPNWYQYSGGASIPDNNATGVNIPVNVSGFPTALADVNVRFDGGTCSAAEGATGVGLTHSFIGDLVITLRSPAGTVVTLMNRNGSTGNNLCYTIFNDGADTSIGSIQPSAAPFSGSFRPASPLSAFNHQNPNGTWTLNVKDLAPGNTGVVRAFTLLLTPKDSMMNSFVANANGWAPSTAWDSWAWTQMDTQSQTLKALFKAGGSHPRYMGWFTQEDYARLPYAVVGPDRYVRGKFYVYAGGQATNDPKRIPNLRVRVANRFAYAAVLDVQHHSNADPEGSMYGADLRPSKDAARPSVYRVDFDPLDIPYLKQNAQAEGIMRMFEGYATEPQEDGFLALSESSLQVYPALPDAGVPMVKVYAAERDDFRGTHFNVYNITTPTRYPYAIQKTGSDLPRAWKDQYGIYLDTINVPANKLGIVTADIVPGVGSEDYDPARRLRVEENKVYKIRFHARSVLNAANQPHIRFRARTAKFAWTQRLEVGGAWAIGTNASTGNAAIARQVLPGVGSQNPDKMHATDTGGWYTMVFNSPLSRDLRADFGNVPLTTSMPMLANQDGPGVNTGKTRRDLLLGVDILDTISPGPNAYLEKGQLTLDRIEIRAYNRNAD